MVVPPIQITPAIVRLIILLMMAFSLILKLFKLGQRICCPGVIEAMANNGLFATPFGLFSDPGEGKSSNQGSL
jgi:hypothetical protein